MAQDRLLHYLINKWSNYHLYYHHSISILIFNDADLNEIPYGSRPYKVKKEQKCASGH
jgi:hypothetical protein